MNEMKGLLVFYVDVGQLPPFKAEAFLDTFKDMFRRDLEKGANTFPPDVGIVWVPSRPPTRTRVEYIAFESADDRKIQILADRLEEWDDEWDEHLEECEEPNTIETNVEPVAQPIFIEKLKSLFRTKKEKKE